MYKLYADTEIKSSCHFVNHLPFKNKVLEQCNIGSPIYRAVQSLEKQPPLAGALAAYAHAFKNRKEGDKMADFYLGAIAGIVLGVIADQNYPISRADWSSLAAPALYFAATGEHINFMAPIIIEEDPDLFATGCHVQDNQGEEGTISRVGDGTIYVQFKENVKVYNFLGEEINGDSSIKTIQKETV